MKAKVKSTGDIFSVLYLDSEIVTLECRNEVKALRLHEVELIPESKKDYKERDIDWEQRRYELAKVAMNGILTAPIIDGVNPNPSAEDVATYSVRLADALIKELKGG